MHIKDIEKAYELKVQLKFLSETLKNGPKDDSAFEVSIYETKFAATQEVINGLLTELEELGVVFDT